MGKNKPTETPDRFTLTITLGQTKKLNHYIIEVAKKQGKFPHAIKTKILRAALDEWFERHGEDYDTDWDSRE